MKIRSFFLFCLSLSLFVFVPALAQAVMDGFGIADLVGRSDAVVNGRVLSVTSRWTPDGTRIVSEAVVSVDRLVRGDGGHAAVKTAVVEYEGGEIGDMGYRVSDAVTLNAGDNIVVFLQASSATGGAYRAASASASVARYSVIGRAQGVYKVSEDGTAHKEGFTVISNRSAVVNNLPVEELLRMIREVKKP